MPRVTSMSRERLPLTRNLTIVFLCVALPLNGVVSFRKVQHEGNRLGRVLLMLGAGRTASREDVDGLMDRTPWDEGVLVVVDQFTHHASEARRNDFGKTLVIRIEHGQRSELERVVRRRPFCDGKGGSLLVPTRIGPRDPAALVHFASGAASVSMLSR